MLDFCYLGGLSRGLRVAGMCLSHQGCAEGSFLTIGGHPHFQLVQTSAHWGWHFEHLHHDQRERQWNACSRLLHAFHDQDENWVPCVRACVHAPHIHSSWLLTKPTLYPNQTNRSPRESIGRVGETLCFPGVPALEKEVGTGEGNR